MRLRLADASDADALATLFTASRALLTFLPALHSAAEDRRFIGEQVLTALRVTVAEDGEGSLLGFIAEDEGWVEHLYLAPDARRMGIGTSLLNAAKLRQTQLDLWCFAENFPARAFYERHGFVAVEQTDGARNESRRPDVCYRWINPARGG